MVDAAEAGDLAKAKAQAKVEALIALGLYKTRLSAIRALLRNIYKPYKGYLKPIEEVRKLLAKEIPEKKRLSEEVVALREMETH